jgi:ADP-ribose diphosphatase
MSKKPEILGVSTIAQTRIFRVEQIDVRFANGRQARYERLYATPPAAVMIVPLLDKDTVLLIREYAVGVERYELCLPKGRVDEGEDIFAAANRELMEEVGYGAGSLRHIKSLSLAPGYVGHTTHVLLATDLYPQRRAGDEPEAIEVIPWPLPRVSELWHQSDCTEARSIAALFMVREHLAAATRSSHE